MSVSLLGQPVSLRTQSMSFTTAVLEGNSSHSRTDPSFSMSHFILFLCTISTARSSQVWSWDLDLRHWRLLSPHTASRDVNGDEGISRDDNQGRAPQPRHWHVAAVFGTFMYIHGGFGPWGPLSQVWKLDLVGEEGWSHVPTTGRIPQARCRSAFVYSARPVCTCTRIYVVCMSEPRHAQSTL